METDTQLLWVLFRQAGYIVPKKVSTSLSSITKRASQLAGQTLLKPLMNFDAIAGLCSQPFVLLRRPTLPTTLHQPQR